MGTGYAVRLSGLTHLAKETSWTQFATRTDTPDMQEATRYSPAQPAFTSGLAAKAVAVG